MKSSGKESEGNKLDSGKSRKSSKVLHRKAKVATESNRGCGNGSDRNSQKVTGTSKHNESEQQTMNDQILGEIGTNAVAPIFKMYA